MKKIICSIIVSSMFIFAGCNSIPEIPADASATQLIQLGQDSIEIANYKAAEAYYNAVIQRFGMNTVTYIEASYELGHLYLIQNRYNEASAKFIEIKGLYDGAEPGSIPAAFLKLAQLSLDRIPNKYKPEAEWKEEKKNK